MGAGDMKVVNSIAQNDRIETIAIEGDTPDLFAAVKADVDTWNSKLG